MCLLLHTVNALPGGNVCKLGTAGYCIKKGRNILFNPRASGGGV